jgi:hypothetical protein
MNEDKPEETKVPEETKAPEKKEAPEEKKAPEKKPEPKPAAPPPPEKTERPKECVSCGKDIQKRWYYREGKYYCGKGCWKKAKKEAKAALEKKTEDKK